MVNELVDVYSRIKSLEADLSLVNYRLDKMSVLIDKMANMGQLITDEGIVEELPITEPTTEEIVEDICDNYCRYTNADYLSMHFGELHKHCDGCPLNKLLDDGR